MNSLDTNEEEGLLLSYSACELPPHSVKVDSDVSRVLSRLALDRSVGATAAGAVKTCYVSV